MDLSFIKYFPLFLVVIFIAFYIPGSIFLKKLKLAFFENTVYSFILGVVLWAWQGYIFGYLGIRWMAYVYLVLLTVLWMWDRKGTRANLKKNLLGKIDMFTGAIIAFGVFSQLTSVWLNGVYSKSGLYFCCGNPQDNLLQLAIVKSIISRFPPFEPGMAGVIIQNYHYWDSLVIAEIVRVFHLPLFATDFQFMTVLISLLFGLGALAFAQVLNLSRAFKRWLLFFLYFGGDLTWMFLLILHKSNIFSMNPLESGQQFLENYPRAVGVVIFFFMFGLLSIWIRKKDLYTGILLAFVASSLIGFKVYIGIFALSGFAALGLIYLVQKKFRMLIPLLVTVLLSMLVYFPVNSHAGGLYFTGFWRFENFIVQPAFGLQRMELARMIYTTHHNIPRIIEYELIYTFIFLVFTFGTKLLGFVQSKESMKLIPWQVHLVLMVGLAVSFAAGSFFNQTSGESNTFNFLVSVFIFGSIYTALACSYWFAWILHRRRTVGYVLIVSVILFTFPRSLFQTLENINLIRGREGFIISDQELTALSRLSGYKKDGMVIVDPEISMDMNSPYISFMTNQPMFLSGISSELESHNINFSSRRKAQSIIFASSSATLVAKTLEENNIQYIFKLTTTKLKATQSAYFLDTKFKNGRITIENVNQKKANQYVELHPLRIK